MFSSPQSETGTYQLERKLGKQLETKLESNLAQDLKWWLGTTTLLPLLEKVIPSMFFL